MKKLLCGVLIASAAIFFISCNRVYSCTCTYSDGAARVESSPVDIKGSKNHALHECCDIRAGQLKASGHPDATCAVPI